MTSHLLYKTRCPACAERGKDRSGDNLGVYSDGHTYCFSCGYGTAGNGIERLKNSNRKAPKTRPDFPEDLTDQLDNKAKEWLNKYFQEDTYPRCLWSPSENKLYFPLPNGEFQYRYFGDNPKHPKWVGYGINENLIHIVAPRNSNVDGASLVLVEDLISALKVGTLTPTMCLFGSNISLKRLATIKQLGYNKVVIWLDWDKKEYAIKAAQLAQSIGLNSKVIHTKLDPKDYDYETILNELSVSDQKAFNL